jgi:hypothetical protein
MKFGVFSITLRYKYIPFGAKELIFLIILLLGQADLAGHITGSTENISLIKIFKQSRSLKMSPPAHVKVLKYSAISMNLDFGIF